MTTDAIVKEAVKRAQQRAAATGLTIGQEVAHPDERTTCVLLKVEGDTATIGWKDIRHTVPLSELFDPNVANRIALDIKVEEMYRGLVTSAQFN